MPTMPFPRIQAQANSKPVLYCVTPEWASVSPIGINGYPLPLRLLELIETGDWCDQKFETCPFREFADRHEVCLFGLQSLASQNLYWPIDATKESIGVADGKIPGTIDPKKSILIGDFGFGSDQPIALDFRQSILQPTVIALQWQNPDTESRWLQLSESVDEFAKQLGL
jgi:hypothetical protein